MRTLKTLSVLALACLAVGCTTIRPAPTSPLTPTDAKVMGDIWRLTAPGRTVANIRDTDSMVPYFDFNAQLFMIPYTGQPLSRGMLVSLRSVTDSRPMEPLRTRGDFIHVIEATHGDYVITCNAAGVRDPRVSIAEIQWIVAGMMFIDRHLAPYIP